MPLLLCFAYTVGHQAYAIRMLSFKKIKLVKKDWQTKIRKEEKLNRKPKEMNICGELST